MGKISDVISQEEFEAGLACPQSGHLVEWTDGDGNEWSGIPLWLLAGWVDDRKPHDYDANLANNGYTILVKPETDIPRIFPVRMYPGVMIISLPTNATGAADHHGRSLGR